jgi:hypothetical protein
MDYSHGHPELPHHAQDPSGLLEISEGTDLWLLAWIAIKKDVSMRRTPLSEDPLIHLQGLIAISAPYRMPSKSRPFIAHLGH